MRSRKRSSPEPVRRRSALRIRIDAGLADPISDREREQARQIALTYIRRFGKKSFIKAFGEERYQRVTAA